jgi:hypothetical protein
MTMHTDTPHVSRFAALVAGGDFIAELIACDVPETTRLDNTFVALLPDQIDETRGLSRLVGGEHCFVEAWAPSDGGVNVTVTAVDGDRLAFVHVGVVDSSAVVLFDVLNFVAEKLGAPATWPGWQGSTPLEFEH